MKFTSFNVVFPANSMTTVAGVCHSELSLLLLDRSKDDELNNDFTKLLLLYSKREDMFILSSPLTPDDLIPTTIIIAYL
jgi:hypothetical protein